MSDDPPGRATGRQVRVFFSDWQVGLFSAGSPREREKVAAGMVGYQNLCCR